jgi:hypothetical protein
VASLAIPQLCSPPTQSTERSSLANQTIGNSTVLRTSTPAPHKPQKASSHTTQLITMCDDVWYEFLCLHVGPYRGKVVCLHHITMENAAKHGPPFTPQQQQWHQAQCVASRKVGLFRLKQKCPDCAEEERRTIDATMADLGRMNN